MSWINSVANDLIKDWAEDEGITYEQKNVYICFDCGQEVGDRDSECENCGFEFGVGE